MRFLLLFIIIGIVLHYFDIDLRELAEHERVISAIDFLKSVFGGSDEGSITKFATSTTPASMKAP